MSEWLQEHSGLLAIGAVTIGLAYYFISKGVTGANPIVTNLNTTSYGNTIAGKDFGPIVSNGAPTADGQVTDVYGQGPGQNYVGADYVQNALDRLHQQITQEQTAQYQGLYDYINNMQYQNYYNTYPGLPGPPPTY